MATRDEVMQAIVNADKAGDSASVRALGEYLKTMPTEAATAQQPAAVSAGKSIMDGIKGAGRQVGLTARYAMEGAPAIVDTLSAPIRVAAGAAGYPIQTLEETGSKAADALGLPKPEGANERTVGTATKLGFGAMGGAGLAKGVANAATGTTKTIASALAANPGQQAVSASAAGGAGQAVKEAGGGPLMQFGAALLGGVTAGLGLQGLNAATTAGRAAIQRRLSPERLDVVLRAELGKQGIDWDAIPAQVKLQLREDTDKAIYSGQPLNPEAMARLVDYRRVGATPLVGDLTQDPNQLTQGRNLAKEMANMRSGGPLPTLQNDNAKAVLNTMDRTATSPLDGYSTGERIIGAVQAKDAAQAQAANALYKTARDAAGRDIPLDRGTFANAAFENLAKSNKTAFLPAEVSTMLNQISKGVVSVGGKDYEVPFNVDTIDSFKTILANASRSTKDGNARAAIKAVRDALENAQPATSPNKAAFSGAQLTNGATAANMRTQDAAPAAAMEAFDAARRASRARFNWQESAPFIEDALGGVAPDKFVQKHIIGGTVENLAALRNELGGAPSASRAVSTQTGGAGQAQPANTELINAIRKQIVDYVKSRGGADSSLTKFSSKGMDDGLKAIGDRKLAMFFSPEEIGDLKAAVNVAKLSQSQPIGSAVNNSNSGAMVTAKLADLLKDMHGKVPGVGFLTTDPIASMTASVQARSLRDLSKGLISQRSAPQGPSAPGVVPLALLLTPPGANGREKNPGDQPP